MSKNKQSILFGLVCLAIFVVLALLLVTIPGPLTHLDRQLMHPIRSAYPVGKHFLKHLDKFGNGHKYNWLVAIVALGLLIIKRYAEAIWVFVSANLLSRVLVNELKAYFHRARPKVHHKGFSFPSGHATSSMIFYGILVVIAVYVIKNRVARFIIQVLLVLMILTVGISRIYLGDHFPSDVLAGYALSLAWIGLT